MKYTVIIRQPVPDSVRSSLEKELVERFGLNEEQAQRLAARRAGRLMKPTSQSRAELLLSVFSSVGAQVALEEVREESDTPSQAFQAAPASDDAELAPLQRGPEAPLASAGDAERGPRVGSAGMGSLGMGNAGLGGLGAGGSGGLVGGGDAFSGGLFTPATASDPFGSSEFSPRSGSLVDPADLLPDWARQAEGAAMGPPSAVPEMDLLGSGGGSVSRPATGSTLIASAPVPAGAVSAAGSGAAAGMAPGPTDDWADFAGGLSLPETAALAPASEPRQSTEFLTAVTEEAGVNAGPRSSLGNQIRLSTLLPLVASGVLTLALLALVVPRLQAQLAQDSAHRAAATLGLTLGPVGAGSSTPAVMGQVVRQSNLGFVQVQGADGAALLRSRTPAQDSLNASQVAAFLKTHPAGGVLGLGGQSYAVQQVSVLRDAQGQPLVTVPANESQGRLIQRVAVGVPAASTLVRNILLLVLGTTLLGLLLAAWLAAQASRRIVQPISDLVKVADAISMGDLTRPVKVNSNDEIGDLAQALERMRLSLEAAMDRLRRRKRG